MSDISFELGFRLLYFSCLVNIKMMFVFDFGTFNLSMVFCS